MAIATAMTGLLGTIAIAVSIIMADGYGTLEVQNTQQNMERVLAAYQQSLDDLDTTNYNWSAWDETYRFIQQPSQTYIDTNFYDDAFVNTNTNLFVYVNLTGQIVYSAAFDLENRQSVPPPPRLQEYLNHYPHLWHDLTPTSKHVGMLVLPDQIILFSARPIVTTNQQGPVQGTLITGRYLDDYALAELADTTRLQLHIYRLHPLASHPKAVRRAIAQMRQDGVTTLIQPQNQSTISGYTLLTDVNHQPVLLLQVDMPREIHQQGQRSLLYLMVSLAMVGGLLGMTTYYLTEKVIQYLIQRRQVERALQESQERLAWQASHDDLTGLVNRREFEYQVKQALLQIKRTPGSYCLCYLDLDQFKIINDTCGHTAGDELLKQVATVLRSQLPDGAILARLGGDEFGLLLSHTTLSEATHIANQLIQKLQEFRFVRQEKLFTVGVSIGVVAIDHPEETFVNLLSAADAACYMAKHRGRNRVHVYQMDDRELRQRHLEMEWVARLTSALEENRLCLYAQPIVPIPSTADSVAHLEVLVRLYDEQGKIVLPGFFIPAAERYNLMHLIDRWVIQTLFLMHARSESRDGRQVLYSINLSGESINDDQFPTFLHQQFALYQIPPQMICFEITETLAIANLNQAVRFIEEFKQLGCQFSLDDFGSGMSSFRYLKQLPVDYVKIDGMFIKDMLEEPTHLAMVEAINHIGHILGYKTIAEFVENEAILAKLRSLGVDYAQGYGIAKPGPLQLPRSATVLSQM